jgi:hypothetical protein
MTARFAISAIALGSIAAAAAAQVSNPLNLSVRFGLFHPSSGTARDEGKSWFAAGLETRFKNIRE